MSGGDALVSIVIPCRDEARYIGACLASILTAPPSSRALEVLVVDGQSTDGTRAIVESIAREDPRVRLLDNPARITPTALNIGIRAARGGIVMRMDAHCIYPSDYVSRLVEALETSGADNVGGSCRTLPADDSPRARAIARALSHPAAVGNSQFRLGTTRPRWVDTVPFGCYRRALFDRIGLFDEALVRNQDDELNHRLLAHGGRILLVPGVVVDYYARARYGQLARMMYQYGVYKPIAARKVGQVRTVRQLVPATFVATLAIGALLAPVLPAARLLVAAVLLAYALLLSAVIAREAAATGLAVAIRLAVAIPIIHVAYGTGYLIGIWTILRGGTASSTDRATIALSR